MRKVRGFIVCIVAISGALGLPSAVSPAQKYPAAGPARGSEKLMGEFSGWGVPVPLANYYFIKSTIYLFGTRWGASPQTEQELEDRVWEQLVLSCEAFRRNIQVDDTEVDGEIDKMLKDEKVTFDWKKDTEAFAAWVKDKTKEDVALFRNQLRHLVQLEKLRTEVLGSFSANVTEDEARNEFINEYNTMELELVQFDGLTDAEKFYSQMRDPKRWEEEAAKDPKKYRHPGFVSFEFLINMWKVPKEDLYKMLAMEVNTVYPPRPIYKGWGVFRILQVRPADPAEFPKVRDSYFKQVEMIKKYDQLNDWLKKLKAEARIKIYPAPDKAGAAAK